MTTLSIKVEAHGGTSLVDCIYDMVALAKRMEIWVTADLNGIHVMCDPDADAETLWKNYQTARDRGVKFVSMNVIPRRIDPAEHDAAPAIGDR